MRWGIVLFVAGLLATAWVPAGAATAEEAAAGNGNDGTMISFETTCDASALVFTLGGNLLVAEDMSDVLLTFRPTGGKPIARHDLYPLTGTPKRARRNFSAFEGAARLGDKIFFVTSHSREEKGKNRGNRRRLLALQSTQIATAEKVEPTGTAYTGLLSSLSSSAEMRSVALGSAIMELHRQLPHLAPGKNGINIEGLAAGKDGESLLLGLRNPRRGERAIIVPILNPERVILGFADPQFAAPILLDLGGLGIASIALDPGQGAYYIIAGHHDAPGESVLYRWSGNPEDAPERIRDIAPPDFEAEAMAVSPDGTRLFVLSDDGTQRVAVEEKAQCKGPLGSDGTCSCSHLVDATQKRFRGQWLDAPAPKSAAGDDGGAAASAKP